MGESHLTNGHQANRYPVLEIDRETLLALQQDAHSDEGLTTLEWASVLRVPPARARKIIKAAVATGVLLIGGRWDNEHWSGRRQKHTVYRVADSGKREGVEK